MTSIYDLTARDIDGNERSLSEFRGKLKQTARARA